jgi:hypothetical protein
MTTAPTVPYPPSQTPALGASGRSDELTQRWARYEARVHELRRKEAAMAAAVFADLQKYPGYYPAAVARNDELMLNYGSRPDLRWAMERWAEIFEKDGLPLVLQMLASPETHQEVLSSSPFYLMRPPGPENDFYQNHVSSMPQSC